MVIMTDRYGLVKVTRHAVERFTERFGIEDMSEIRDRVKNIIDRGKIGFTKVKGDTALCYKRYKAVLSPTEDNKYLKVVTITKREKKWQD